METFEEETQIAYYPTECEWGSFNETEKEYFNSYFDLNCKSERQCSFTFRESWLPSEKCTVSSATAKNWQYIMMAVCKSD